MTLILTRALEIDIKLTLSRRISLERILTLCQREGVRYPAILLRRKKPTPPGLFYLSSLK